MQRRRFGDGGEEGKDGWRWRVEDGARLWSCGRWKVRTGVTGDVDGTLTDSKCSKSFWDALFIGDFLDA